MNASLKRWPGWLLLLFCAVLLIAIGAVRDRGVSTPEERAAAIEQRLGCPTCDGQSVYESQAPAAVNIRGEVRRWVEQGVLTDDEIVAELEAIYEEEILLLPTARGVNLLVWALPVAAAVAGVAGLALAFARWRRQGEGEGPTDDDRAVVAAALAAGERDGRRDGE